VAEGTKRRIPRKEMPRRSQGAGGYERVDERMRKSIPFSQRKIQSGPYFPTEAWPLLANSAMPDGLLTVNPQVLRAVVGPF
jgi:hypothetical protein